MLLRDVAAPRSPRRVRIDLRSPNRGRRLHGGQVASILSVLDREEIGAVVVVGTSFGGMLGHALTTAASAGSVRSLVLCSSGLYDASHGADLRRSLWMARALPERLLGVGARRRIERLVADAPDGDVWILVLCEAFDAGSARRTLLRQQRLFLELVDRLPDLNRAHGWAGPSLLLRADDDPLMPAEATQRLVAAHPGAVVRTLATGGHLLAVTRPDDVADAIAEFVGLR